MANPSTRRRFLKDTALAGAGLWIAGSSPSFARPGSANEKLHIAGVGVGGKGHSDLANTAKNNQVVALCDVDDHTLSRAADAYPGAQVYHDWRKLLERQDIDAVTVSTPDHMHAPVAMAAMELGKHVYVQKPMAHTVKEARLLTEAARKYKVVSQMGNQGHSGSSYRSVVRLVRSGVIGKVKEAHAWSNRPIWPQGIDRPEGEDPVPPHLHWDLWLGVAPHRPYLGARGEGRRRRGVYHPFSWRGWLDFGVGALGDMGCHIIDPIVWGLDLAAPSRVWYEGPRSNGETYPDWERIHYEFPATKYTSGAIRMTWHDGGKKPEESKVPLPLPVPETSSGRRRRRGDPNAVPDNASLFIGEKGSILCQHGGFPVLLPTKEFADVKIERVPEDDHYQQWTDACKGQGKATSHFDYSGPLTETVLLGTVAMRVPREKLEWDAKNLRFENHREANRYLEKTYRKGWKVSGLVSSA